MTTHESARCHNCETTFSPGDFRPLVKVGGLHLKLQHRVGDEVPAGECLKCGSFVYSVGVDHVSRALGVLQKDYWDDVRGLAESLEDEVKDGDITSMDQLQERLHEDCDGAQRVIYTMQAKLALVFSDNDDAYEQEYGGEMPEWSQLAYCAFYRDVQERLDPPMCEMCGNAFATVERDGDSLCKDCANEIMESPDGDEGESEEKSDSTYCERCECLLRDDAVDGLCGACVAQEESEDE